MKYPETLEGVRKLIGKNLRRIRLEKNLFQKELAYDFKVSATNIAAMEKGVYCPSIRRLCVLSNILGVAPSEFFKDCKEIKFRDYTVRNKRK